MRNLARNTERIYVNSVTSANLWSKLLAETGWQCFQWLGMERKARAAFQEELARRSLYQARPAYQEELIMYKLRAETDWQYSSGLACTL